MKKLLLICLITLSIPSFGQNGTFSKDIGNFQLMECREGNMTQYSSRNTKDYSFYILNGEYGGELRPELAYNITKTKKGIKQNWSLDLDINSYRHDMITMKKPYRILIRFFNDRVCLLSPNRVYSRPYSEEYGNCSVTATIYLTKDMLDNIINQGIKKIRFETYPDIIEYEFKTNEIGKFVSLSKKHITDNYITPKQDKLFDGF